MKYPFPVGSFIYYNGSLKGIGRVNFRLNSDCLPDYRNQDLTVLYFSNGILQISWQESHDRILKISDLENFIPYLSNLNVKAKEFLKEATLWCILRETENKT